MDVREMNTKRIPTLFIASLLIVACTSAKALEGGAQAPAFELKDLSGKSVSLSDFNGKTVVLEWFNRGCPFVQKHYRGGDMQTLQKEFSEKGIVWLLVNSTHSGHKDYLDNETAKKVASEWKITSASLLPDESGVIGRAYRAKTTPHMFIVNPEGKLAYQGAIDDKSDVFSNPKEANNYVRQALNEMLSGKEISIPSTEAYGCSVKYGS